MISENRISVVKPIFLAASRFSDAQRRKEYLDKACAGQTTLRIHVEALLAAQNGELPNPLDEIVEQLEMITAAAVGDSDTIDPAAPTMIGPYRLLGRLGEGGMGTVYMARQQEPVRRHVALKLIKAGMDSKEVIARFNAERQALAMMNHSHIAHILDAGMTDGGRPYFVMELVHGVRIDQYCDDHKLRISERLRLFIDVCAAVQHAHLKGIIHRDLKPSNILVSVVDGSPTIKVIDFGIAKALDREVSEQTQVTGPTVLMGTPVYMSPEQAEMCGQDVDTRSDVYSLGVLLYKLLAGVTPFDEKTLRKSGVDQIRRVICEEDPPRPSRRLRSLDIEQSATISDQRGATVRALTLSMQRELDWIVLKALDKDRQRRYQSASELADDVQRFLHHQTVTACPPTIRYRIAKSLRRNRALITSLAVIMCILAGSSAVAVWQALKARDAWRQSLSREQLANDLLEASQLQSALSALRQKDLNRLAQTALPRSWPFDSPALKYTTVAQSLGGLLHHAAVPSPQRSFPHGSAVTDVTVSADGSCIVSVDAAGTVRLWKPGSNAEIETVGSHISQTAAVSVSPDGTRAVTGGTLGQVWFWDLQTKSVQKMLRPLQTGIETVVWSANGRYIAAGARYSETWVCDADGHEVLRIANDSRHEALLFSPDSTELYVPTREGIDVWNLQTRTRDRSCTIPGISTVRAMCLVGSEQQWLAVGDQHAEELVFIDRQSGRRLGSVFAGLSYAQHLAASPDGRWLAAIYSEGQIQLFHVSGVKSAGVSAEIHLEYNAFQTPTAWEERPRAVVRWLPDSRHFLTGGDDGDLRLWDCDRIEPIVILKPPSNVKEVLLHGRLPSIYFFHDSSHPAQHGNPRDGTPPDLPELPHPVHSFAISVRHQLVAMSGAEEIAVLSLKDRSTVQRIPSTLKDSGIEFSHDAKVIVATDTERIAVWQTTDDWKTHRQTCELTIPSQQALSADQGRTVIVMDLNDDLAELSVPDGKLLRRHHVDLDSAEFCLSHDDQLIAAEIELGLTVWNRRTGEVLIPVTRIPQVTALGFAPDDRTLLSGHLDGTVRAWHIPTGQRLGLVFQPNTSIGFPVDFLFIESENLLQVNYQQETSRRLVLIGAQLPRPIDSSASSKSRSTFAAPF